MGLALLAVAAGLAQSGAENVLFAASVLSADVAASIGVDLTSLDDLCAISDYLTLHMPSTPETKNLFNDERFAKCKKGIRLINTARGGLVDTDALIEALDSGRLAGAGLDVVEDEELVKEEKQIGRAHV